MWTSDNRARYDRSKLRYPSDLTDAEWALIGPLIPPAKRGGNKRTVVERDIVNGLECALRGGQNGRFDLTLLSGLSEDGSHDEASVAQRRVQAAGC